MKTKAASKTEREFHISDVLSVTTGRLVSTRGMDGLYDILGFMTNDTLWTHQLPRASDECKPFLLEQFPRFDGVGNTVLNLALDGLFHTYGKEKAELAVAIWLAKLIGGDYFEGFECPERVTVKAIPKDAHEVKHPVQEMCEMVGPEKVVVVGL